MGYQPKANREHQTISFFGQFFFYLMQAGVLGGIFTPFSPFNDY